MFSKNLEQFFDSLCHQYYEKVLLYLYSTLNDEYAARDCVQEVFLVAYTKRALLMQHPNPGGFLFQTAKNLYRKMRRESFAAMMREAPVEEWEDFLSDNRTMDDMLDSQICEEDYIEEVLSQLTPEKRELYNQYYLNHQTMAEVAERYGLQETAMRMRYVRLRREIRQIAAAVAEKKFVV